MLPHAFKSSSLGACYRVLRNDDDEEHQMDKSEVKCNVMCMVRRPSLVVNRGENAPGKTAQNTDPYLVTWFLLIGQESPQHETSKTENL